MGTYYQQTYQMPDIHTLEKHALSIFNYNENIPVRLLSMDGILARAEISGSDETVIMNFNEEIKDKGFLQEYKNLFTQLMKKFFYESEKTYIYFLINNGKIYIYDIYTNSNYMSQKDLEKIKNNYDYGTIGFQILEPIASGILTTAKLIEIMNSVENPRSLYLLPYFYLTDNRTFSYKKKDTEEDYYFIGEKKTYGYTGYKGGYYNDYYDDDYYGGYYDNKWSSGKKKENNTATTMNSGLKNDGKTTTSTTSTAKVQTSADIARQQAADEKSKTEGQYKIFMTLDKKTRSQVYKETKSNVSDYLKRSGLESKLTDVQKKEVNAFSYLFGIYSTPSTRELVFRRLDKVFEYCIRYNVGPELFLAEAMYDIWKENWKEALERCKVYGRMTTGDIQLILKEELMVLYSFYMREWRAKYR